MRWLFDVLAIVAVAVWQRARVWPALRLVTGSTTAKAPAPRVASGVIAVLVSDPSMEARVRWALGWRATLCFTHTWAELEAVAARTPPLAVFADPLADATGDAEGHLARIGVEGRVPVILYTALTPAAAGKLLTLGQRGIRHVIFSRLDDSPERLNAVVDWGRVPPQTDPPWRAA